MQSGRSVFQLLSRLWCHIGHRRRVQFTLLLVLTLLTSFAEVFSIGVVLPFLGVLTAPELVYSHRTMQPVIKSLGLTSPDQLLLPLTIAFSFATLIAGAMRMFLLWVNTRLSFATGADLGISIYHRTLYQPYAIHCARNSSEVISGISGKTSSVIYGVIMPALSLISASVILIAILVVLLAVEPIVASVALGGFGLIYSLIIYFSRRRLLSNSQCIARESVQVIKSLQEGLGGIRDVLIDGSQALYCEIYRNADMSLRRAQGDSVFISASPRYGLEALGMIFIAVLAYLLAQQPNGVAKAIPILGALALGAQRLLPILQQAYASWTSIQSSYVSLHDTLELLDQPLPEYISHTLPQPVPFKYNIQLKRLGFRYSPQSHYVLKQVNLTIGKGSRVGFIGITGSGKSTLLDIMMGLLQPTEGHMEVDGQVVNANNNRGWQAHIAHVPQVIYLADGTVEENIAFGVSKDRIDSQRVKYAAQQAQIAESIESWPDQYQTFVGERGVRLSGGQRQRIGIARALYKQADVIIFDEATSALDNETEKAVMQAVESLNEDITVLIIAHRLSTLKNCTQIIELSDGAIKRVGSYQDIAIHS